MSWCAVTVEVTVEVVVAVLVPVVVMVDEVVAVHAVVRGAEEGGVGTVLVLVAAERC